jgi:hypothetical protein
MTISHFKDACKSQSCAVIAFRVFTLAMLCMTGEGIRAKEDDAAEGKKTKKASNSAPNHRT